MFGKIPKKLSIIDNAKLAVANVFTANNTFTDTLLRILKNGSAFYARILATNITANRDYTLQDKNGVIALLPFAGSITANKTFTATDRNTQWNITTNNLLDLILPLANTFAAGEYIQINSFTIGNVLDRQGSDTIRTSFNTAATRAFLNNGTEVYAYSDGVSRWDLRIKASDGFDMTSYLSTSIVAGAFVVGRQYEILTAGTTNFTLIGAANSTVGTIFTATGVGTGTGTAIPSLFLNVKESAYMDFTAQTSMPLRLGSGTDQELVIRADGTYTQAAAGAASYLQINNINFTNGFSIQESISNNSTAVAFSAANTDNGFRLDGVGASLFTLVSRVFTRTSAKRANIYYGNATSTIASCGTITSEMNDTTTVWTTLGTLIFPNAWTGRVRVTREI